MRSEMKALNPSHQQTTPWKYYCSSDFKTGFENVRKDDNENDDKCIDVYVLLKVVTNVTQIAVLKDLWAHLFRKYPAIKRALVHCCFNRQSLSPGLPVEGAYHLLIALGDTYQATPQEVVHQSCLVVGRHLGLNGAESSDLFEKSPVAAPKHKETKRLIVTIIPEMNMNTTLQR